MLLNHDYVKTTLEISDALLLKAKAVAKSEHTTLRALTEEGLAKVLDEKERPSTIQVKPVTFKGEGLGEGFEGANWSTFRDAAYGIENG